MKKLFLVFILFHGAAAQSTFTTEVDASADDARETSAGVVNITNANGATLTQKSVADWGGARFLNIAIPRGAKIVSAMIVAYDTVGALVIDATIFAEASDNATTFTTATNNISSRTRTSASIEWDVANTTSGQNTSPDISTIVQEVVNRSGFTIGNAFAIIMRINTNNTCNSRPFDGNPTKALKLNVTWSVPRRTKILIF